MLGRIGKADFAHGGGPSVATTRHVSLSLVPLTTSPRLTRATTLYYFYFCASDDLSRRSRGQIFYSTKSSQINLALSIEVSVPDYDRCQLGLMAG